MFQLYVYLVFPVEMFCPGGRARAINVDGTSLRGRLLPIDFDLVEFHGLGGILIGYGAFRVDCVRAATGEYIPTRDG